MHDHSTQAVADRATRAVPDAIPRRDFLGLATVALGGLIAMVLAIPGAAYILSPLRRKARAGALHTLTGLNELEVGVPKSFAIIEERQDSWVKYPREPVGSVWLIRQPPGSHPPVLAFQSECPHLGCAVNLKADRSGFLCPCHTSAFTLEGAATNQVPPRPMDRLEVEVSSDEDPQVRVRFQRFRTAVEEKIPLA
jgi:menaquinol-cytochrome c reductase iron-sulfur subunit